MNSRPTNPPPEGPEGLVFDIQRFSIHDGPGIRTTVFLKGCALKCLWCHNPESIDPRPEISFLPEKCIGCGWCVQACPNHCHVIQDGRRLYDRTLCARCGKCAEHCYAQGLEVIGKAMTVEAVVSEVLKDWAFYQNSAGGLTISGGEPMVQFAFTKALLEAAKRNSLHTCLDTSGLAPWERFREILALVDIFLYDIKETDSAKHREYTGAPNDLIFENLRQLDAGGAATILRCPVIPGFNDREEHLRSIARLANALSHVLEIYIEPYHPLGRSKSVRIGKEDRGGAIAFPGQEDIRKWQGFIQELTKVAVKRA